MSRPPVAAARNRSLNIEPTGFEAVSNTFGFALWEIDVPFDLRLDGVDVLVQAARPAPGWNPAGIVLSASLRGSHGAF